MESAILQVSDNTIGYIRKRLMHWGRQNFANFPWRYETSKFHALVAELLLQRTKAEQVVNVYYRFKERFPDPTAVSVATLQEMESIIAPLGLRWRAKFLLELGRQLTENSGEIPRNLSGLQMLPGVGPYASAAYLSFHEEKRAVILDSNIIRFLGRFFDFNTGPETRHDKTVMELAGRMTPKRNCKDFNYALIDFTRLICTARTNHEKCPVIKRCALYGKTM